MSDAAEFKLQITALDKASATIRQVRQNIRTSFDATPLRQMEIAAAGVGQSLAGLARETGIAALTTRLQNATGAAFRFGRGLLSHVLSPLRSIGMWGAGFIGIGGLLSGAGLIESARKAAENAADIMATSVKTGVPVREIAQLRYVAKQSDVEPEKLTKGLEYLNRSITSMALGKLPMVARAFRAAGVDIWSDKTHRRMRATGDIFRDLAEAVKRNYNNTPIRQLLVQSLSAKGGAELLPLLVRGKKGFKELGQEYEYLHGAFTKTTGIAGTKAVEAWRRLDAATEGLRDSIGYALAPAITSVITPLTEWIAKNRELISSKVGEWAKDLANWLVNLDWKKISKEAAQFAKDMKEGFSAALAVLRDLKSVLEWVDQHNWNPATGLPGVVKPEPSQGSNVPVPKKDVLHRAIFARKFFQSQGLDKESSAVLAGSGMWEGRGLNPNAVGDHGTAHGIMQWRGPRIADFERVLHKKLVGSSFLDQLRFSAYELTKGKFKHVGHLLRAAKTLEKKTEIIDRFYEMPKDWFASFKQRLADAKIALNAQEPGTPSQQQKSVLSRPFVPSMANQARGAQSKVGVSVTFQNAPRGLHVVPGRPTGKDLIDLDTGVAFAP
jgi:hypothetical protein